MSLGLKRKEGIIENPREKGIMGRESKTWEVRSKTRMSGQKGEN